MRIQSLALALSAAAALSVPAMAADDQPNRTSVRYHDLDLSTEAGQKELDRRLDKAARQVCGMNAATTGSRVASRDARDCYRQARTTLDRQFAAVVNRETRGG